MARVLALAVVLGVIVLLARWLAMTLRSVPVDVEPIDPSREYGGAVSEPSAAGKSPNDPIAVSSPVLIESTAADTRCVRCNGEVRVENHEARIVNGVHLRVAPVRCKSCGYQRELYPESSVN